MTVVAQVGLPRDELSTVTALISSVPNLGGVLGVGIIGNGDCLDLCVALSSHARPLF